MSYTRLTKKDKSGFYHYNCTKKEQKDCLLWENCGECYGSKVLRKLGELEDKIEQGTLIEFPRIVKTKKLDAKYYVEIISDLFGGIIDCYEFDTREEAEKRLKELQNG